MQRDRVYYNLRTHLEMLNDRQRCLAYRQALETVVRDKIVLDVGCGSGLLSFFAARAGAELVLAVDMDIPPAAEDVARKNGLADRVRFYRSRIEDAVLPVDSVDVIVSEWMGGILLMEDMLPAVLYARDRWLKPGGLLLPDQARLFLAPLRDVAGISSREFPGLRETISSQVWVSIIDPSRFLAKPACILDLDLYTMQAQAAASYRAAFRFVIEQAGELNGFALWFDVAFNNMRPPVLLSTAPWLPPTHWAQALWILPVDITVEPDDELAGDLNQVKVSPSAAFFTADVGVTSNSRVKASFHQELKADPANMNSPGENEQHTAAQALAGAFQGKDCLWIGCSMSFAALMVAGNGAKSINILNHSPWAERAMRQLAAQQGLSNVRFLSKIPPPEQLLNKEICLLGAADSSWQALLSHIQAQKILGRASFRVQLSRQESPWKYFYGFDFSNYAPYDIEMYNESGSLAAGLALRDIDIIGEAGRTQSKQCAGIMVYTGCWPGPPHDNSYRHHIPAVGLYNIVKIDFNCGLVVFPLPQGLSIDSGKHEELQRIELAIFVVDEATFRFRLMLACPAWTFIHDYDQPLAAMGHIVRI